MPHDMMPIEAAAPEPEFDDLPAPPDPGSSILAAMKQAGRTLVTRAKRNATKGVMLAVMAAAGAALCAPLLRAQDVGCQPTVPPTCGEGYPEPGRMFGGPGDGSGTIFAGDPVNVGSGNVFLHITDYKTAGPNPLAFVRYYNSLGGTTGEAPTAAVELGYNWRSNYDRYLYISPATNPTQVIAEKADGFQMTFNLSGSTWVTDSDLDYTLTKSGSTWTLTGPDDSVETYSDSGTGEGVLQTITARNGYQQTMSYSDGQLSSVTDSYGRSLSFSYSGGLLQTVTTPDSLTLTYGYDTGYNNLTSVSYNTSPATSQTYTYATCLTASDGSQKCGSYWLGPYTHNLASITDENGNVSASWTYSTVGEALTSQNGGSLAANLTSFAYNEDGTITVTNPFGVVDTYSVTVVNGASKISGISRAATSTTAAATESFSYDANGYLASKTDWNGNTTNFTNNSHGLPTQIVEASGSGVQRTTNITYDGTWVHLPSSITTPGLTRSFTYDASGNPATQTDTDTTSNSTPYSTNGQTRTTTWTWNSTGEMTSVQLPRTDATVKYTLAWGSDGALNSITDPLSHTTSITAHTGGGYPTTIVDPNSVTTTLAWDTRLNLNTVTVATGAGNRTTTYTHDAANNLTAIQRPDGSQISLAYDAANRLTTITDLPGNSVNLTLDAMGDATALAVKNSSGTTTLSRSATFDALGRPLTTVGGASQTTSYTWDPNSNLLSVTDPLSNTVNFTYDALNRLATRADPSPGGTTTFTLDAYNRLTNVQDANGNSTSYTRNGFGDITQVTSPDTGTRVYTWDKDRNLTQKVFNGGQTVNLTYDAADRNLTIAYPSDSSLNVSKTYDQTSGHGFGVGRLTSVTDQAGSLGLTYDERGNITNESRVITSVGTLTTATAFDANNNISSITYPSGTVVAYTRDSMGLVTGITAQPPGAGSPSNIATSITRAPFGPVTGLTFGNGVTGTYSFDNDYRATSRVDTATSDVLNLAYTYFANNSLKTITDSVNTANSQTLGYDALDRLTSAVSGTGGYGTYGWTWDKVGNVATQTINGTATTFNLNSGSNQLASMVTGSTTTTVDTTANGNIADFKVGGAAITSFTYNQANQMASGTGLLGDTATYEYGFQGQRLLKTPSSGYPITYQYAQAAKELLSENDLHSGQTADYIYMDPGRNSRPVGQVDPTSGNIYFMHTGRLGTVQAVTDSSKNVVWTAAYNPFGDTNTFSGTLTTQSLRLPGQYFDPETGNNHNGFRDYAGTLTRYVQSDPLGLGGGMNTYQYVLGNPFKYTDRLGLDPAAYGGGSRLTPNCPSGSVLCTGTGGNTYDFMNQNGDPDTLGQLSQIPYIGGGGGGFNYLPSYPDNPSGTPGLPLPTSGGGGGNGPTCKPNDPICGNNPGDPILTSTWQNAVAGGADGFADGFLGGELFGPEVGPITGIVGLGVGGSAGGMYGAFKGIGQSWACYAGRKYQNPKCKP